MARALETARIVAEPHGLAVQPDRRLREFDFGAWEGLTWDEIVATRPHLGEASWAAASLYAPEGGETFDAVRRRVGEFLEQLASARSVGHVVVVTHAGALHASLAALELGGLGVTFKPAGITRIAMEEGTSRLISVSDVRHLDTSR